jgi:hypothetical protein
MGLISPYFELVTLRGFSNCPKKFGQMREIFLAPWRIREKCFPECSKKINQQFGNFGQIT